MNAVLLLPLLLPGPRGDQADLIGKWITTKGSLDKAKTSIIRLPGWLVFEPKGVVTTFDPFMNREEKGSYKITGGRIDLVPGSLGSPSRSAAFRVEGNTLRMWDWKHGGSILTENIELVAVREGAKKPKAIFHGGIGADFREVDSSDARELAGADKAGIAIEDVSRGSLAQELGLMRNDVIVQVNGRPASQIADVTGPLEAYRRNKKNAVDVVLWRAGSKRGVRSIPPIKKGPRMVLVGNPNSDAVQLLAGDGLDIGASEVFPASFEGIGVVIIQGAVGNDRTIAPRIKEFVRNGGGVVLIGQTPIHLSLHDPFSMADTNLQLISEWFGTNWMADTDLNEDPELVVAYDRPFGIDLRKGERLYKGSGTARMPYLDRARLAPSTRVIAEWKGGNLNRNNGCAAIARTFGKGRVYYQFAAGGARQGKLSDLFTAGVKWAGGKDK